MTVEVLMFGVLADVAAKRDTFDISLPTTAATIVAAVGERYPDARSMLPTCAVAVNLVVVEEAHDVRDGDEVALLPPVSGGAAISVALTDAPSVAEAIAAVAAPTSGGTAVFVGTVRDSSDAGPVTSLEYSAYDDMAVKVLNEVAGEAVQKWAVDGVCIRHAIGPRWVGEVTFVVVCTAAHRDEAFGACRYVTDEVKRRAPVWKRECGPWGKRWVGP